MNSLLKVALTTTCLVAAWLAVRVSAQIPAALIARDGAVIATFHAEGAQIYQCKPDSEKYPSEPRVLAWQFREPIATLIVDGKSIGWHSAGPNWNHTDGSGAKDAAVQADGVQRDLPAGQHASGDLSQCRQEPLSLNLLSSIYGKRVPPFIPESFFELTDRDMLFLKDRLGAFCERERVFITWESAQQNCPTKAAALNSSNRSFNGSCACDVA